MQEQRRVPMKNRQKKEEIVVQYPRKKQHPNLQTSKYAAGKALKYLRQMRM